MPHYAAIWVNEADHAKLVELVRASYLAQGASEGGSHTVLVGEAKDGWAAITDSTYQTVDLGVAEALATALKRRVLAAGMRGSGSHGTGAARTFGPWKKKLPTSAKPGVIRKLVEGLGEGGFLQPWDVVSRPGTTLSFTLGAARRALGPFKTTTDEQQREQTQHLQIEAIWHLRSNSRSPGTHATAYRTLGGLIDHAGWQTAFDSLGHSMFTSPHEMTPPTATLLLHILERARVFDTPIESFAPGAKNPFWATHRLTCALVAAAVAGDQAWWDRLVALLDPAQRAASAEQVWKRMGDALEEFLTPAMRTRVVREFPPPGTHSGPAEVVRAIAMKAKRKASPRDRAVVTAEEITAFDYVGDELVISVGRELQRFRDGRLLGTRSLGRGFIGHVVRVTASTLLANLDRKIVEVALPGGKVTEKWSGQGETISTLAVSPGSTRVVFTGAAYGNPGRVVAYDGKKPLASFANHEDLAWLDDERLFGVVSAGDKLSFWVIDAKGKEVCYGGKLRARLGGVAAGAGAAYVATSTGIYRVHLDKPSAMASAAKLDLLWEGEAHDLAIDHAALYAATSTGVHVIEDGKATTLSEVPASGISVAGGRVAFLHADAKTGQLTVHELH